MLHLGKVSRDVIPFFWSKKSAYSRRNFCLRGYRTLYSVHTLISYCKFYNGFRNFLQTAYLLCVLTYSSVVCTNDFALSPPSISSVLPTDCVEIDSALSGTTFRLNYSSYVRPPAFSLTSCCWGTQSTPLKTSTEIFSFRLMFW